MDTDRCIRLGIITGIIITTIITGNINQIYATELSSWVENLISWYKEDKISQQDLVLALEFLIKNKIISLDSNQIQNIFETESIKGSYRTHIEPTTKTFESIPAASGTILNFYVNDDDLNTSPNGVDIISTKDLINVTINGIQIDVPSNMVETSPSSGKFALRINLPDTLNGKSLQQDDILVIKYFDQSDVTGNMKTITSSVTLTKAFASIESSGGKRIGHEFTIRLYEPDANKDSKNEDKISLGLLEFRSGGIRTTLSNPVFDARSLVLLETGPNTNVFETKIKIPRNIDGKTIHIGDSYEIRYIDSSTPSRTLEKIILQDRIG